MHSIFNSSRGLQGNKVIYSNVVGYAISGNALIGDILLLHHQFRGKGNQSSVVDINIQFSIFVLYQESEKLMLVEWKATDMYAKPWAELAVVGSGWLAPE